MSGATWNQSDFCHVGNSAEALKDMMPNGVRPSLFLTDPPYNIGHKYGNVSDRLKKEDYRDMIKRVLKSSYDAADDSANFFMIHYPEAIAELWPVLTKETGWKFKQWLTWVYPSNIGMSKKSWTRASRTILWLVKDEGGSPKFYPNRIVRPYRNPWDSRVSQLMSDGKKGCSLYDWWEINLTKNVNKEKSDYSNQIPQTLLRRIIRSTTDVGDTVADPFSGTFSTVKAALATGRLGWGCDMNQDTRQYWPTGEELDPDYEEEDFTFDQEQAFDTTRANITASDMAKAIRHSCESGVLPARKTKWTLTELDFIEGTRGKK